MRKKLWMVVVFVTGIICMIMSSCGDDEPAPTQMATHDINGNENSKIEEDKTPEGVVAVDLGLPSGTQWANMNVGAVNDYEYGGKYAWGEIETKNTYSWQTYKYGNDVRLTKYSLFEDNLTELEQIDDVASVNWGNKWRTPSYSQWQELKDKCTWKRIEIEKIYMVTGSNGNYIMLPIAGAIFNNSLDYAGAYGWGFYWSRNIVKATPTKAYYMEIGSSNSRISYDYRYGGFSVRPVRNAP